MSAAPDTQATNKRQGAPEGAPRLATASMTRRTVTQPIRHGGGAAKIDWNAARSYFARNVDVSFGDVARRCGVSDTAVRKHARAEGWLAYRAELHAEVARRRHESDLRSLEERQADFVRVAELLRGRVLTIADDPERLAELPLELAIRELPDYLKLERLIEGEATDRISVPEVREFVTRLAVAVDELLAGIVAAHLANGKRAAILADFRARFGLVLEQAAGVLPAGDV